MVWLNVKMSMERLAQTNLMIYETKRMWNEGVRTS